ncbi:MAG: hypothetical protein QOE33_3252 [Acidobacteriota bacterium]|nr:hypothetical protein [Acidobacteriota bacterium]
MKPERETLEKQKREAEDKVRSLKSYVTELTGTVEKCGTDSTLLEADLTKAKNDAQFFEDEAARLGESLAAECEESTYWVQKDSKGEWRWHLRAENNRIIADSGEGYTHKHDCLHAIDLVKASSNAPVKEK